MLRKRNNLKTGKKDETVEYTCTIRFLDDSDPMHVSFQVGCFWRMLRCCNVFSLSYFTVLPILLLFWQPQVAFQWNLNKIPYINLLKPLILSLGCWQHPIEACAVFIYLSYYHLTTSSPLSLAGHGSKPIWFHFSMDWANKACRIFYLNWMFTTPLAYLSSFVLKTWV